MSYLMHLGYLAVRMPRADLQSGLILIEKNRVLIQPDLLSAYFRPDEVPAPEPSADSPAANFQGGTTGKLNIGVGLSILGSFMSAMGAELGINVGYQQAKTVEFQLITPTSKSMDGTSKADRPCGLSR